MDDSPRWNPWLVGLLALAAAAYAGGLGYDLVYDDAVLIAGSRITGAVSDLPGVFTWDLWESTTQTDEPRSGYYRPLFLLSLWVDRLLPAPMWAAAHHAQSLLWHLVVVALVGALARRLGASPAAAAAGAAVAALHPAQVATVQFVAARNDSMAVAFALALCLVATSRRGTSNRAALVSFAVAVPLGLLAGLSKESTLLVPFAAAAVGLAARRDGAARRRPAVAAAGAVVGIAGALVLRMLVGGALPRGAEVSKVLSAAGPALVHWLGVVGWPVDLAPGANLTWGLPPVPAGVAVAGLALAGLLLLGGWTGRAALFAGALLTVPALVGVAGNGLVPDRYLYAMLAFGGVAVAVAVERLPRGPRMGAVAVLASLGALGTLRTVPTWQSDVELWRAGTRAHPQPFTWGAYGKALEDVGLLDEAAAYTTQAATTEPPLPHACLNVARLHLRRGAPVDAGEAGLRALDAGCPSVPELLSPTSLGLAVGGRWDEAEGLATAVGRDPTGQAVLVRCAAAARRGDLTVLADTASGGGGDPAALQGQVAWLLRQSGDEAAALAVEAAPL